MGARRRRRDDLLRLEQSRSARSWRCREAFQEAHELGMCDHPLVLPAQPGVQCQGRRPDYHVAADLTGQANHLGVTIEADIIKQKLPETTAPGFRRPQVRQDRQARLLAS